MSVSTSILQTSVCLDCLQCTVFTLKSCNGVWILVLAEWVLETNPVSDCKSLSFYNSSGVLPSGKNMNLFIFFVPSQQVWVYNDKNNYLITTCELNVVKRSNQVLFSDLENYRHFTLPIRIVPAVGSNSWSSATQNEDLPAENKTWNEVAIYSGCCP